jgi:hypothetical protein
LASLPCSIVGERAGISTSTGIVIVLQTFARLTSP